jgi:tetratricopeptide (TPR) repeat protein
MGKAQRRKQERVSPAAPAEPVRRRVAAAPRSADPARLLIAPALIVIVGMVLYANSFSIPFLFDDFFEISGNPMVKSVEPLFDYLRRARGIPALTFALNYRWGGFDLWGFHAVNVAVHLINGLLVYALVLRTLRLPGWRERYGDHAVVLAGLVALVFVVHPLQTMAASYIVQRGESIAACFYLVTLLLFSAASTTAERGRRAALYGAAAVAALLGVISKEIVATVPVAALLYRLCFLSAPTGRSRLARVGVAALLLVPFAYAVLLSRPYLFPAADTVSPDVPRAWLYIPTAGFQLEGVTPWQYLLTQFGVIVWYLRLYLLPTAQCFDYGWPLVDGFWRADVLVPLIVLLALVGAALASYRRYPLATFCLLWVFVTLAPTSSIVPLRDAAFEQRMYLPIVGLSWLIVVGAYELIGRVAARTGRPVAMLHRAAAGAAAAWIVALGAATIVRNGVLQDPVALAADSVAKAPGNWRAHSGYGEALLTAGRTGEAMPVLEEAVRLNPRTGSARIQLGQLYAQAGRLDDAVAMLTPATAVQEESVVAAAHVQLANIWEARGDVLKASWELEQALALKPGWAISHRQLAMYYTKLGAWYPAAAEFRKAVALKPSLASGVGGTAAQVCFNAAVDFQQQGKPRPAVRMLREALLFRPGWASAQHYLAYVYASNGAWSDAERQLQEIAASNDPLVLENLRRARAREPLQEPPNRQPG